MRAVGRESGEKVLAELSRSPRYSASIVDASNTSRLNEVITKARIRCNSCGCLYSYRLRLMRCRFNACCCPSCALPAVIRLNDLIVRLEEHAQAFNEEELSGIDMMLWGWVHGTWTRDPSLSEPERELVRGLYFTLRFAAAEALCDVFEQQAISDR